MNKVEHYLNENNKETRSISAFPGCGKTHFFKNAEKNNIIALDSDSSKFDKKAFPENYIKHIKENIGKVDIICISSHDIVRDALVENNLKFDLVYPDINIKQEYLSRYKNRGSDDNFVKLLDKNWDNWIGQLDEQSNCNKIKLKEGQYLSDVL